MYKLFVSLLVVIFLLFVFGFFTSTPNSAIDLSKAEKEWLKKNNVIRVANETDWAPFDFNQSGKPKGLAIDHINLLANRLNIEIEFVYGYSWSDLIKKFKNHQIDVIPVFYKNDKRTDFTLFTDAYFTAQLGIFTHTDTTRDDLDLSKIQVGMETDHGSIPLVKKLIPGIKINEVDFKYDLVKLLGTKQLDAIIGNPFVFYYYAKEYQITNIRLADYIDFSEEDRSSVSMHIGIRKDLPILHGILQKAMKSVTEDEMATIKNKWADISIVDPINWEVILETIAVIFCVITLLVWHNRHLNTQVQIQTRELRVLNEELESKVEERTEELRKANAELKQSIEKIETLHGIIPICASCKKIRDDSGCWNMLEVYISQHSLAEFSHGICPDCIEKLYPDFSGSDLFKDDVEKALPESHIT